jgi:hypothetical protein
MRWYFSVAILAAIAAFAISIFLGISIANDELARSLSH